MLFMVPEASFLTLRRVACTRAAPNVPLSVDGNHPNPHSSLPVHPRSVGRRLPGPQGWGPEGVCSRGAGSQSGHRSPTLGPSSDHPLPRTQAGQTAAGDSGMSSGEPITRDFYTHRCDDWGTGGGRGRRGDPGSPYCAQTPLIYMNHHSLSELPGGVRAPFTRVLEPTQTPASQPLCSLTGSGR